MPKNLILTIIAVILLLGAGGFIFLSKISWPKQVENKPNIPSQVPQPASTDPQYLTFQLFTSSPDPAVPVALSPLATPPSKGVVAGVVQNIVDTIGTRGTDNQKLGFIIGPLAFDHTDAELRQMIRDAFAIAREKNVAIGFHIEDSQFWAKRKDLWSNAKNIEWLDWAGTPNMGRRTDTWGKLQKFAPQMCLNAPAIRSEVTRIGETVIGREIKVGMDTLKQAGKEQLFAGIIAGWETHMDRDYDTGKLLGYCALTNLGFSAAHPPTNRDHELEGVVQGFIELWSKSLVDAGVPKDKVYAHTAFIPKDTFDMTRSANPSAFGPYTYSQFSGFAPSSVAFGRYRRPGFTTYPPLNNFEEIYAQVAQHGNIPWASSEAANVYSDTGMESYLGKMFNHGANLVNIFAWGIGGDQLKNNDPFRVATEGAEAISAYKKFLSGGKLSK